MRWHSFIIRIALNMRIISSAAYHALRTSKSISLLATGNSPLRGRRRPWSPKCMHRSRGGWISLSLLPSLTFFLSLSVCVCVFLFFSLSLCYLAALLLMNVFCSCSWGYSSFPYSFSFLAYPPPFSPSPTCPSLLSLSLI